MARVEITSDSLIVHTEGVDRLLALKSSISVPLTHVVGARHNPGEASGIYHGLRLPGTNIPGIITAGTYLRSGEWSFWDVHDPQKSVVIELRDEHYGKVLIGVEDPVATVNQIQAAIGGTQVN